MNNFICEIVLSVHENDKINVDGFFMVKDKSRNNAFYWYCERRDELSCNSYVVTRLVNGQHYLRSAKEYNHSTQASRVEVVKMIARIKDQVQLTREKLAQVLQTVITDKLFSLEALIIPDHMKRTLSGLDFLIHNSIVERNGFLIFTTIDNIRHLNRLIFWIMDGTFWTCEIQIFWLKNCNMPLHFCCNYNTLYARDQGVEISKSGMEVPAAAINSVQLEFDFVQSKGCHFHFSQCIYRKVQAYGLASRYSMEKDFSLLIRSFSALAFLPPSEIPAAYEELKTHIPAKARHIIRWFEETFIYSRVRHMHRSGNISRLDPLFSSTFWSVFNNIKIAYPRTQNSVEGWHRRWDVLVGCAHMGIFKILKEIQKEQNRVELDIEAILRGALRPPQRRHTIEHEQHIQTVFNDCGNRSIIEYLHGIAYNLAF
ncbi:16178_t:CDS:2 [Dentiscutata heterogama]|uniref:16178_t:CDS:1 n=1 Tax=Dentiscutata heterogama TaxID=1316150 RepID=A0ACA9NHY8_9GLOM|nr:16178_t:CDS:2 [Dentiscutata heterogama]